MSRPSPSAIRRSTARVASARRAPALASALLLLAGLLPASAAPPSKVLEEHLVAQAGLAIGLELNLVAQLYTLASAFFGGGSGCVPAFGSHSALAWAQGSASSAEGAAFVYYDSACQQPYFTDTFEVEGSVSTGGTASIAHTAQFIAPGGAILGALTLAQQYVSFTGPYQFSDGGTYRASGSALPVHVGLACSSVPGPLVCQAGFARDFPSLKLALGVIVPMTLTYNDNNPPVIPVSFTGTNVQLATGKLGGLSISVTPPTTVAFKGQHKIAGTGSLNGASPDSGVIPPATTAWSFVDTQHAMKFAIATAGNLASKGNVTDTSTLATLATFQLDQSGTGTITYSDKSKAKIINWTLAD